MPSTCYYFYWVTYSYSIPPILVLFPLYHSVIVFFFHVLGKRLVLPLPVIGRPLWRSHEWWRTWNRQLFSRMLPGSLLPPFLRREPRDEANLHPSHKMTPSNVYMYAFTHMTIYFGLTMYESTSNPRKFSSSSKRIWCILRTSDYGE